jgi:hypothetical protein
MSEQQYMRVLRISEHGPHLSSIKLPTNGLVIGIEAPCDAAGVEPSLDTRKDASMRHALW